MKRLIHSLLILVLYVSGVLFVASCGNKQQEQSHDHEHVEGDSHNHDHEQGNKDNAHEFQCPMKCEGDKVYEAEGSCPECGMDLEPLAHDHNESDHDHEKEEG